MKEQNPLISVIMAVYNGADSVRRCIDSVSAQTYQNRELIIIDGGSQDGTTDILKKNNDKITYWESKKDRGIYHAWNKALKHARGEWENPGYGQNELQEIPWCQNSPCQRYYPVL